MTHAREVRAATGRESRWLLLIHRLPVKPHYLRVKVGRELRALGAVAIKNSVYVVVPGEATRRALAKLAREIVQRGGEAAVCEAAFVEGLGDGAVEDLFRAARDVEYVALAREANRIGAALPRGRLPGETARRGAARRLERLRERFATVVERDAFGARERERTANLLSLLEDRLQGVDVGRETPAKFENVRGARWVTRVRVMVDRIASAWLIRRFIDPEARFKFVPPRGYLVQRGEIRFDMAGAEFTHRSDRCTFEVLVEDFRLRDSALAAVAAIVHDLDLEDGKFGRPEAAGVGRLIVGLAITEKSDEQRLAKGAVVFDNLYESFRRGRG